MKKILGLVAAFVVVMLSLAAPASATGGGAGLDGKDVTFCHATGKDGKYVKLTLPLEGFLNGHYDGTGAGHTPGDNQDIWPSFTYVKNGVEQTVTANGDQSLLAFPNCAKPTTDTPIAQPDLVVVDKCETKDDSVSVPASDKYTSNVVKNGLVYTVTITAADGFTFLPDGLKVITKTVTLTDVPCGLPDTGVGASFNTAGGFLALGGVLVGAMILMTGGLRRNSSTI